MGSDALFTAEDAWAGGYFELLLVFDPSPDVRGALTALWSHPDLRGCFAARDLEPEMQRAIVPADAAWVPGQVWYGVAVLPNGGRAPCLVASYYGEGLTEIYLGIPMASLGRSYRVGAYPFADDVPLAWRDEVGAWMATIADAVFAAHPFRLGLVGWEVSLDDDVLAEPRGVPEERWDGWLWPVDGAVRWCPPTRGAPCSAP